MNQSEISRYIKDLNNQEQELFTKGNLSSREKDRLHKIEEELNVYWDLLRQRRAYKEFGQDPNNAKLRDRNIIDNYEQ